MNLPTAYWGSVAYYRTLLAAEDYRWEVCESFPKQTMRNRCVIRSQGEPIVLSIPVCKVEHKQLTRDVEISYQQRWQHQHWMALVSAYGKTPYWMYYEDFIRPLYQQQWRYLIDYNWAIHQVVLDLLHAKQPLLPSADRRMPLAMQTADWQGPCMQPVGEQISILDWLCQWGNETLLKI